MISGFAISRDLVTWNVGQFGRQQTTLNFAGNLQIAFDAFDVAFGFFFFDGNFDVLAHFGGHEPCAGDAQRENNAHDGKGGPVDEGRADVEV